jgi:diguanylate cyclase (GGDEF)-like protein
VIVVLLALLWSVAPGWAAGAAPTMMAEKLPTLISAGEVHDLTSFDARRRYPVHLRVTCVVCFAHWHGFFVSDGSSGVFVEMKNQALLTSAIHSGQLLDIVGVTGPGDYAPIVDQATVRVIREVPLPPARLVSIDRLTSGIEDGQWVAFEGTVRSAEIREGMLNLVVASGRMQIGVATTLDNKTDFNWLVHARVRISAGTGPVFNKRGQILGVNAYAPSQKSIQILQPAPADPFSIPLSPVSRVFDYVPGAGSDHLVRIRGVVTARWGQTVFISDSIQGVSVLSNEMVALKPGDLVEAVGFPSLGDTSHTIEGATFKQFGTAPVPVLKSLTVEEALSGNFDGELVRMDGRLIGQQVATDQTTLLVDQGGTVFSAILPRELKEQLLTGLQDGSRIQLTGICVISETKTSRHYRLPTAFQILLRTPGDVVVRQQPSWWTASHTLVVLLMALTGICVVLGWVVALRRQVYLQTILLRESESRFRHMALHDSLTGLATRVLLQDRLKAAVETARRHRAGIALLMVDLDKFKQINDTYGHQFGDEVLCATADRLLEVVRKSDTVARIGGDEFVVLLPDVQEMQIAERIAANIVEKMATPVESGGVVAPVSVSVGVCSVSVDNLDSDALMQGADTALYEAKAGGRNCFRVFTPGMSYARATDRKLQDAEAAATR